MASLKNKVVVITGASSGIGKAAALEFAKKKSKIVLAARRTEKLKELENFIKRFNPNVLSVQTDVSKKTDVQNLFNQTEKKFGQTDILVNNAGRGLKANLFDTSDHDWDSVINTNLKGVFLCSREAAQRMIAKKIKGHIITVSSIAGLYGAPSYGAYCASKHGVTGFKRSIRFELKKHQIKTSTIHPARIDTEFFNIYKKRPHRSQMLSPRDIALYLVAIASRSLIKRIHIKILNIFKRVYYLVRYSV
ncbi:SDR family oxidoreductase [Candidatus Woesearchaeota archaeon]|nr:SDR family oxidoreductase [Candidatus Woesearchaeota archaeon]